MPRREQQSLTSRQLEMLACVVSGDTIEEAAERCYLARQSGYNILSQARDRVNAKTIPQLAIIAWENGWLERDGEDRIVPAADLQAA